MESLALGLFSKLKDPELIYFRSSYKLFKAFLARDMATEVAAWGFCVETSTLQPGRTPAEVDVFGGRSVGWFDGDMGLGVCFCHYD